MAACTRKLRQERGASVVFALVIFLIVTIFSWTMVNGALTAAQNASMQREEEQAYLNVTSAARLFCQRFEGNNVRTTLFGKIPSAAYRTLPDSTRFDWSVYWDEEHPEYRKNPEGNIIKYNPETNETIEFPLDLDSSQKLIVNVFKSLIKEIDCRPLEPNPTEPWEEPSEELYIVPSEDMPSALGTIKITLTMDTNYYVTAKFSKYPDPDSQNLQYLVSVTLKCTKEDDTSYASVDPVVVTKTLTWEVKSVERGRYS